MTGDPHFSNLEHLLARAGRMRSLARALCADAAGAEDLVQDAFVAALERGPARSSSPSAWIARVLANLSTDRRRAESARREREQRSSRAEATPSAGDLVERAEVQRRLVECVLALPEPYRATVLERWFEERTPDEIARRLGIPASTVRTRLARGLALLRERLEREEGRSWMAALAPLVSFEAVARPASVAAPSTWIGGALVSTGAKVAIGIGVLAAATWIAWPRLEGEAAPIESARAAAAPVLEEEPRVESRLGERSALAEPPKEAPAVAAAAEAVASELTEAECEKMETPVPASTLAGIVLRGRVPVPSGTVYLRRGVRFVPHDPREPWVGIPSPVPRPGEEELKSARVGGDGRFAFEGLGPDWYTLAVDLGRGTCRQMYFNLMRGSRPARTVVIVLGTAEISGHVYDDAGAPVAGARIVASLYVTRNEEVRGFSSVIWTDPKGAYRLGELPAGKYQIGMRREGSASDPQSDESLEKIIAIGERKVVDFGRRKPMPVWRGVVRARTGEPAAWGRLELVGAEEGRELHIFYDATGAFRVALLPGRYTASVRAVGDPMRMVDLGTVEVPERGVEHDLVLPGTRVRGIAIDATTGAPWAVDMDQRLSLRPLGQDYPAAIAEVTIGPGGEFFFDGVEPGTWIVQSYPRSLQGVADGTVQFAVLKGELEVPLTVTIGTGEGK